MTSRSDCVFCEIITRKEDRKPISETKTVAVIKPREERNPGHVLVVPKAHFENIVDVDPSVLGDMALVVQEEAGRMMTKLKATGVNVLHATGKDAGQSVFHLHLHVVPRYPNDGLHLWLEKHPIAQ